MTFPKIALQGGAWYAHRCNFDLFAPSDPKWIGILPDPRKCLYQVQVDSAENILSYAPVTPTLTTAIPKLTTATPKWTGILHVPRWMSVPSFKLIALNFLSYAPVTPKLTRVTPKWIDILPDPRQVSVESISSFKLIALKLSELCSSDPKIDASVSKLTPVTASHLACPRQVSVPSFKLITHFLN